MSAQARVKQSERGMTLIEIMLTLGISGIVSVFFFTSIIVQQDAFLRQLDTAEAQQNARAAMTLVKRYVKIAGWGFNGDPEATGTTFLGGCFTDGDPKTDQYTCDGIDGGSDRIRIVAFDAPLFDEATAGTTTSTNLTSTYTVTPLAGGTYGSGVLAAISGTCSDPTGAPVADLVSILVVGPPIGGTYNYTFAPLTSLACSGTYSNANFSSARIVDIFIDRTQSSPRLMLNTNPVAGLGSAKVIAYDIDDLQIRYLIDMSDPVDQTFEAECDTTVPGVCAVGDTSTLTDRQVRARIVGAKVAIVPRTRHVRASLRTTSISKTVLNHTLTFAGDGYARWVYRSTIAMRNNDL